MDNQKLLTISGWVVAVVLIGALAVSKFDFSIRPKASTGTASSTAVPRASSQLATASDAKSVQGRQTTPAAPPPRELTTQELFQNATPSVVLIQVFDSTGHQRAVGSGFIASSNGEIITNYHVIRGATRGRIKYHDSTVAQVLGATAYDPDHDVAVLKAGRVSGPVLQLGDPDQLQVGQKLVAIGSPLGLQDTLTEGIVSAKRENLIQMSVPISPGSSGGPVLDTQGHAVGIAVATVIKGQNLNFAVPVSWAKRYLGSATVRPLADISAENLVTESVLDGNYSVAAGQILTREFQVDPNSMAFPELEGQVSSRGGFTGNISFALVYNGVPIYACNRQTSCVLPKRELKPGTYAAVIDNRGSMMFKRDVTASLTLRYVK